MANAIKLFQMTLLTGKILELKSLFHFTYKQEIKDPRIVDYRNVIKCITPDVATAVSV